MIRPFTDYERQYVRWYVWEPLRRHDDLRTCFSGLFEYDSDGRPFAFGLDLDKVDDFCKIWHFPYPLDPDCEFEKSPTGKGSGDENKKMFIQNPEWALYEWYKPLFDHAVFFDHTFDPNHFIVQGSFIPLLINRHLSQNMVLTALKKELDDWWPKWKSFYGGKRQRDAQPVKVAGTVDQYQRVLVNLAAPRKSINSAVAELTAAGKNRPTPRHTFKKREAAFKLWDLVDKRKLPPEEAAKICKVPKSTAYDWLNEISQAIYGVSFIKSRLIRYRTVKQESPQPKPEIDRTLEITLQKEFLASDAHTLCEPIDEELAIKCKIVEKPVFSMKKGPEVYRAPKAFIGFFGGLSQFTRRWRQRRIHDILVDIINEATNSWRRKYGSEKTTPFISELLRIEEEKVFYMPNDRTNFDGK